MLLPWNLVIISNCWGVLKQMNSQLHSSGICGGMDAAGSPAHWLRDEKILVECWFYFKKKKKNFFSFAIFARLFFFLFFFFGGKNTKTNVSEWMTWPRRSSAWQGSHPLVGLLVIQLGDSPQPINFIFPAFLIDLMDLVDQLLHWCGDPCGDWFQFN